MHPLPLIPMGGHMCVQAVPWGQILEPGHRLQRELGLYFVQVVAIDGLQQHQKSVLADRDFNHRKSLAGVSLVLERPSYRQHGDRDRCV